MYSASLDPAGLDVLRANPQVLQVEADKVREVQGTPDDAAYGTQWALPHIGWDAAYGAVQPAGSATVAVLDTGINPTDDLGGNLVPGASMIDGVTETGDANGHGTAMASIVAAGTNNGIGIAGVGFAGVSVMPVKVLGADGLGQDSDIVAGVVYAADHGADVILMSFSNPGRSAALQAAADYAWSKGAVLVAATGNDSSTTATYPAGLAKVVGVSGTTRDDALWSGSNSGADTFLGAPGVDLATGSGTVTGTSASAAVVAGSAALLMANDASAGNGVIVGRLARTADAAGNVSDTGNGRLNLARALSDAGTDPVVPEGVAGDGGPYVGPYVVAASTSLDGWMNTSANWGGTLQGNNSAYTEGASVPIRFVDVKSSNSSSHTVSFGYDFDLGSGKRFVDALTSFNYSNTPSVLPCPTCTTGSGSSFGIPMDGTLPAGAQIGGQNFRIWNGTITNVAPYTLASGVKRIAVTYTTITNNQDVVIAFGAHLARQNEWGPGMGASSAPGASAKVYAALDGGSDANVSVNPGQAITAGGSISGTVYNDANGNGAFDTGEAGIAGVALSMTGTATATAVTNASGAYTFSGLFSGTYAVDYTVPTGYANTGMRPITGITLATNTSAVTGKNFFAQQTNGVISGTVYNDANGNGSFDSGESGIPGVTVSRGGGNTITTNASGVYSFSGLLAGPYTITYTVPTGFANTGSASHAVSLVAGGSSTGNNFFAQQRDASISGTVYDDANGNGSFDSGESGIAGVTVSRGGGNTTTNASGGYSFTGLAAGSYTIDYTVPSGYANTGTKPLTFSLTAGQAATGRHFFAQQQAGSISGVVRNDDDGDGINDAGETGTVNGVVVFLDSNTNGDRDAGEPFTSTAGGGAYSFASLAGGTYRVDYETPSGYAATSARPATVVIGGSSSNTADFLIRRTTSTVLSRTTGTTPSTYGDSITFTAVVSSAAGDPTNQGRVTFSDGDTILCASVALSGGAATCSTSTLDVDGSPHAMTATYTGSDLSPGFSGSASNTLQQSVTKKQLTVTADDDSKEYGSTNPSPLGFGYTGFEGSDGAGDIDTPPTCSTTALLNSSVGSYPITCQGAADGNYSVSYVDGTLNVTKKGLTITVDSDPATALKDAFTKVYGQNNPDFSVAYDGFTNGDGPGDLDGTLDYDTAANASSPVGPYTVSASGLASDNYSVSYVDGTLNVTKKGLTITVDSDPATALKDAFTKVYGQNNPDFSVAYDGFTNGDGPGDLDGTLDYDTAANASSPVGPYTVSASGLASDNYSVSYVDGTLNVTKKGLTITVDSDPATALKDAFTKVYGQNNPDFSVAYDGFTNGDGPGDLDGTLDYDTAANASSPVGPYTVSASGLASDNYSVSYVDGTLNVTKKGLTITVDSDPATALKDAFTKVYGQNNPDFSVAYDGFTNGDGPGDLDGTLDYDTAANASSPVGPYTVSASGLASDNYSVSYVDGTLNVTKKGLTITVDSDPATALKDAFTKVYGQNNPDFSVAYDGFTNGDGPGDLDGTLDYDTAANASSPVGPYTVSASGLASDNYSVSYVDGTLNVTKKGLTITVDSDPATALKDAFTKVYGQNNPDFSVAYDGFTNGDGPGDLDGTLDYDTAANASSPVGPYTVSASGLASDNYSVSYVDGTLNVTKKGLTITVDSDPATALKDAFTKVYGQNNPDFSVAYDGFTNGDGPGDLDGTLDYDTAANASSPVGPYTVSASGLASDNYSVSYVDGTLNVTKKGLTITVDSDPATALKDAFTKVYGQNNPDFSVAYDGFTNGDGPGDLDGTLDYDTAANASSPVGPYTVSASGLASDNYSVSYVDGTLNVTKKGLTITVDSDPATALKDAFTKVYGQNNPDFSVAYDGFTNGDGPGDLDGTLDYDTAANASSPVGPYTVSASGLASDNYSVSYVDGTLNVTKKGLTITVDSDPATALKDAFTKVYGQNNPDFSVAYDGFTNGDGPGDLDGTLDYDTAANASSPVGPYTVSASGLASDNYSVSYVDGTLNVTKKGLTITVDSDPATALKDAFTKVYGQNNPDFSVAYDGFTNGDGPGDLDGTLDYDTAANASSPVGPYTVSASGLASDNYSVSYVDGTLNVTKKGLTITVDSDPATALKDAFTKVYGQNNPDFSVAYDGFTNGDGPGDLDGTLAFTTVAGQFNDVGTYVVSAGGQTSNNYTFSYVNGSLDITKKTVTGSFTASSKVYDGTATAAIVTRPLSGVVNSDAVTMTGGVADFSDANVGDGKTVTATGFVLSGAKVGNYALAAGPWYTTANITKKSLTITASAFTKVYGSVLSPTGLEFSSSGLVSGESISSVTLASPGFAGGATVAASPHTITPSGAIFGTGIASNYAITYVNGSLTVTPREANVAYIGQTTFVSSGSSSTTAQVTLTASLADPDGSGSVTAGTVDFYDLLGGKMLASNVKISAVANSGTNTGTATTTVTLSTGQYGAQQYLIEVRLGSSYRNTQQTAASSGSDAYEAAHPVVTVMIPPTAYSTQGAGAIDASSTAAGRYADADASYTMGLKYNNKGTNPQGQVQLVLRRADGVYYVKSNSISSLAFSGAAGAQPAKDVTIYTKASIYKVGTGGSLTSIDGGVTLRVDAHEGCTTSPACTATSGGDSIGFTVLSSKTSELYYSNNWVYDSAKKAWATVKQPLTPSTGVVIN
jgi:protocatechuate 3,4-dioxygenase beta subunit